MAKCVTPQVYLVGCTEIKVDSLDQYLRDIGVENWETDAGSDPEVLSEVMGRVCYRSFAPGLNPNVTKIREGNEKYLANIIAQRHGSVFEHAVLNFIFTGVSRVFTHELVRHRVGVAISQESMRYVRLQELGYPQIPDSMIDPSLDARIDEAIERAFEAVEREYTAVVEELGLDDGIFSMEQKKRITSKLRRMVPMGVSTAIGWSCNFRTLRTVLEQRTAPAAEVEMRLVFGQVARIVCNNFPSFFSDFVAGEDPEGSGILSWAPSTPNTVKI